MNPAVLFRLLKKFRPQKEKDSQPENHKQDLQKSHSPDQLQLIEIEQQQKRNIFKQGHYSLGNDIILSQICLYPTGIDTMGFISGLNYFKTIDCVIQGPNQQYTKGNQNEKLKKKGNNTKNIQLNGKHQNFVDSIEIQLPKIMQNISQYPAFIINVNQSSHQPGNKFQSLHMNRLFLEHLKWCPNTFQIKTCISGIQEVFGNKFYTDNILKLFTIIKNQGQASAQNKDTELSYIELVCSDGSLIEAESSIYSIQGSSNYFIVFEIKKVMNESQQKMIIENNNQLDPDFSPNECDLINAFILEKHNKLDSNQSKVCKYRYINQQVKPNQFYNQMIVNSSTNGSLSTNNDSISNRNTSSNHESTTSNRNGSEKKNNISSGTSSDNNQGSSGSNHENDQNGSYNGLNESSNQNERTNSPNESNGSNNDSNGLNNDLNGSNNDSNGSNKSPNTNYDNEQNENINKIHSNQQQIQIENEFNEMENESQNQSNSQNLDNQLIEEQNIQNNNQQQQQFNYSNKNKQQQQNEAQQINQQQQNLQNQHDDSKRLQQKDLQQK